MARPAYKEIPFVDPLTAFQAFADEPFAVFLDSADEGGGRGRYSYIAANPIEVIEPGPQDPFDTLRRALNGKRIDTVSELPPFQSGLCGFLGYELGRHIERLPTPKGGLNFPDLAVGLFDTVISFDTYQRKAWIVASELDGSNASPVQRIEMLAEKLARAAPLSPIDHEPIASWDWEMDRLTYEAAVSKAIDYIHAGDIFQANVTTRAVADLPRELHPFMLYRRLRWANPSPFAAYVSIGSGRALLSASPERFLRLERTGHISTRPIKGTRPRGDVPELDAALAVELTDSKKDRAENLMIVDLLRNDISRVALIGSVEVGALCELETFARVHHLVSEVTGKIRPGFDVIDLFRATFPGGSVTGAPKIRAMEIIHELEPSKRSAYCGSVFWAGSDGAMDSSIVIRSMMVAGGKVAAHAGGGIVADSLPAEEYDEMRTKAAPMLSSLSGENT